MTRDFDKLISSTRNLSESDETYRSIGKKKPWRALPDPFTREIVLARAKSTTADLILFEFAEYCDGMSRPFPLSDILHPDKREEEKQN